MLTTLIFLIVLAVLIFVHELGHFLAARAAGIRIDAFKIGFGPRVFYWTRGETEYGVNAIPFGGYVKIHGENPDEESVSGPDASRSFVNKPQWKQVVVLAAGVFFNFLFAWLLYSIVFVSGVTIPVAAFPQYEEHFSNNRIMVAQVAPGSPAEKAGIMVGDTITNIKLNTNDSSQNETLSVEKIQHLIKESAGTPITLSVINKEIPKEVKVNATTGLIPNATSTYALGIAMQDVGDLHLPFFSATKEGLSYTWTMISGTAVGLYKFITNIFMGKANFSDVTGPIGIAGVVGDAAGLGFTYLLMITALISINLGVINLVPFPALDGGRILFVLIEGVIRRRISMKFTNIVNTVGFVLLMLLMVVVTYKDVLRLFK